MSDTVILLVEDNALNQRLLVRQLAYLGVHQVEVVDNGAAALDWLAKRTCLLVLADCQMPGMDGYEMSRRIRAREAAAGAPATRLPILALTASALEQDKEVCLAAGMDDHIAKPASIETLRGALRPWLGAAIAAPEQAP